jgi:hypothetical protein
MFIHRTKCGLKDRLILVVAALAGVVDALVLLLSLTLLNSDLRAKVLFSDWAMPE